MNNTKNLPLEAQLVSIKATAEEARKVRASLLNKVTVIKKTVSDIQPPQGPILINGQWW